MNRGDRLALAALEWETPYGVARFWSEAPAAYALDADAMADLHALSADRKAHRHLWLATDEGRIIYAVELEGRVFTSGAGGPQFVGRAGEDWRRMYVSARAAYTGHRVGGWQFPFRRVTEGET